MTTKTRKMIMTLEDYAAERRGELSELVQSAADMIRELAMALDRKAEANDVNSNDH